MANSDAKIIVFAKPPISGQCKTRLGRKLGDMRAAAIHRQLAENTLHNIHQSNLATLEIHTANATNHPWFAQMRRRYACPVRPQRAGDLGQRMFWAARQALQSAPTCMIAGTDCPVLSAHHLRAMLAELNAGKDAVFLPSEDGGYALIGLRKAEPGIFRNIDWGTSKVMQQTRQRLRRNSLSWSELAPVWDIDEAADYYRARKLNLL
ncbi:MAG: TIGR04282 family arsenosugar biosynthesis glycosyltransferase [Salinisphaeraceae bacterium]|nr:TIGR04282 family arsenosugar biosynthesis glycosyltransferase [Salinisphaeraceae bacterium]